MADTLKCFQEYKEECLAAFTEEHTHAFALYGSLVSATQSSCYKARRLWEQLRPKFEDPLYTRTPEMARLKVVVVGAGIAGLCAAIECALCGAGEVTVLEKRDAMDRRNVLHLWPSVGQYLKAVGAKVFYSKLLCGNLDCCSIWRLQLCLLKTALLCGVRVVPGTAYSGSAPLPGDSDKWVASTEPPLPSKLCFDALIGAEGERSAVAQEFGFDRKVLNFGPGIGAYCWTIYDCCN